MRRKQPRNPNASNLGCHATTRLGIESLERRQVLAADWTIMVYITGDNLNQYAFEDINEMESALTKLPGSVKIVTAWDQPSYGSKTYATGGGSQPAWSTYGLSVLQADANMNSIKSPFDLSRSEQNTGDPATLETFITWGVLQAPADRYILQIWDHGSGLTGSNFDRESGNDGLEVQEVVDVLDRSGVPAFEILSYDNCLMGMAEIGFSLATNLNGYFVASEDLIKGAGQDYRRAYQALATNPATTTAAQVAAGMVFAFGGQYPTSANGFDTFSAAKTSAYAGVATALRTFTLASDPLGGIERAAIMGVRNAIGGFRRDQGSAYRDLGTFMANIVAHTTLPIEIRDAARQVNTALAQLVSHKTNDYYKSSGVSIYLPKTASEYPGAGFTLATYRQKFAEFCEATEWDRFASWLQTGMHVPSTNPSNPPVATPTLSVGNASVTEGDTGVATADVVVTLSAATAKDVTFVYALMAGTASSGTDFAAASATIRIPAGAMSATIQVRIIGDRKPESAESFAVRISNAVNATIQTATGTVTITDNDVASTGPTVTVTGSSIQEGHYGTPVLHFTVTLASASTKAATVAYVTVNGTARAGEDYFPAKGAVTFQPGETSKTVNVRVVGDVRVESDETLALQLSKPVGLTLGTSVAVGTILNDDSSVSSNAGKAGSQGSVKFSDASILLRQQSPVKQAAVVNILGPTVGSVSSASATSSPPAASASAMPRAAAVVEAMMRRVVPIAGVVEAARPTKFPATVRLAPTGVGQSATGPRAVGEAVFASVGRAIHG